MSEAQGTVDASGVLTLQLRLDLLRQLGGPTAYHGLSLQGGQALSDPLFSAQWRSLLDAVEVRQNDQSVVMQLISVAPPQGLSEKDFDTGLSWPMTELVLLGQVDPALPLRLRFSSRFAFEEPIALTLSSAVSGKRQTRLLVANQRSRPFAALPALVATGAEADNDYAADRFVEFAETALQGAAHVLPLGLDHLLFLLCLYLGLRTWQRLLLQVSLFTLAHSLSLAVAAYKLVPLNMVWVEILIAGSVLWVALSLLMRPHQPPTSAVVIVLFGLLHGLGFANALLVSEPTTGDFLLTLVAFNVGVELGQIAFLGIVALLLTHALKQPWGWRRVQLPLSSLVAVISSVWVVQRLAVL